MAMRSSSRVVSRTGVRFLHSSAPFGADNSTTPSSTASSSSSPHSQQFLYGSKSSTAPVSFIPATSISSLSRPGGRSSVSGIVATVFGSTGFLGRYIVNNLGRIGSQVIVPYRGDGMKARHLKLSGDLGQIVPIPFNLSDADSILKSVSRSNVVVNSLGSLHETGNFSYDDVNVKLTYRLAQIAKQAGVERFIHISCLGADVNSSSKYFKSKGESELAVKYFFPDATILRPAPVFGAEDKLINYYSKLARHFIAIPVVDNGETLIQPIFVADVARAVLGAITYFESVGQTYHLAGPTVYKISDIIDLTVKHLRFENIKTLNLPEAVAKVYGRILSGDRPLKHISAFQDKWIPEARPIGQILDKLRFPNVFHEDIVEQMKYNLVVPEEPGILTLADLNVQPTTLESQIEMITQSWRRYAEESGGRFEHLAERGPATTPLI